MSPEPVTPKYIDPISPQDLPETENVDAECIPNPVHPSLLQEPEDPLFELGLPFNEDTFAEWFDEALKSPEYFNLKKHTDQLKNFSGSCRE